MSSIGAWIQASRPLAQANIAVPLAFGQALAFAVHGAFEWRICAMVFLFGVFDQLFIVFANDAADWKADLSNQTYNRFSGGSRVIAEGKLTPNQLALAALAAVGGMAAVSVALTFTRLRALMVVACAFAVALLWAYSFPPLRLSYRGRGELLQALGLGVVLPVIGFYAQANELFTIPGAALFGGFLLGYAGNVTTALPDTPSDREHDKRTYPVRRGERIARRDSLLLLIVAIACTPWVLPTLGAEAWLAASVLPAALVALNTRGVATANSDRHAACERFVLVNGAAITATLLGWSGLLVFGA